VICNAEFSGSCFSTDKQKNLSLYTVPRFKWTPVFLILFFIQSIFFYRTSFAEQFSGSVVDMNCKPIMNARVRLQGSCVSGRTNKNGNFNIHDDFMSNYIIAWKSGFYNGGQKIPTENKKYLIVLNPIDPSDNKGYKWLSSQKNETLIPNGTDEAKPCGHCHPKIAEQWGQDAHSSSATNPVFLSFFNGTHTQSQDTAGPGYKLDFPNSNGNCATCHVPALALNNPFNSNPNDVQGVAGEGIFCDFCHKISKVKFDPAVNNTGILSYDFIRPEQGTQIFYGPYDDVFPGKDSYHPLYKKSEYCAPCHHGKFWDVLVYSEFQEWRKSSFAKKNIHCQNCHMKPDGEMTHFA